LDGVIVTLTPNEYQEQTQTTAIYPAGVEVSLRNPAYLREWLPISYCATGLNGEAGEIANLVKKALRDEGGFISTDRREKLFGEIGDAQWYISELCTSLGFKLEDVMEYNLVKLNKRQEENVLTGDGSDR